MGVKFEASRVDKTIITSDTSDVKTINKSEIRKEQINHPLPFPYEPPLTKKKNKVDFVNLDTPTITPSTTNGSHSSSEAPLSFQSEASLKSKSSYYSYLETNYKQDNLMTEIIEMPDSPLVLNSISTTMPKKTQVNFIEKDLNSKPKLLKPLHSQSYYGEKKKRSGLLDDRITGQERVATATAASLTSNGKPEVPIAKISRHNTLTTIPHNKPIVEGITIKAPVRRFTLTKSRKEIANADNNLARYGTKVDKEHNNYELMYNMLTGIRISVSRCTAKAKRPLAKSDFTSANKLAFDITGNELTPSSKYDFKFKDYSPWIFRSLRELFGVDPAEYLLSLTLKYILSELNTPGKSGSFFYYSQDFRFIIKTVHYSEHKFFRKILPGYYEHVKANPNTLLSRIYGLHRVKMPSSKKIHFVVMANVLPPTKDIHAMFDLKGSTFGRYLDEEVASESGLPVVLKDLNWLKQERKIILGPEKRNILFNQLCSDVDFLSRHNIMDYSLLIGIHNLERGNKDKLREATLSVFDPTIKYDPKKQSKYRDPSELKLQVATSDPISLNETAPAGTLHELPAEVGGERLQCIFYKDEGGFLATNEEDNSDQELYCMGIIDIMTPYSLKKRFEHLFKSINHDQNEISCVNPNNYAQRFLAFLTNSIKNNSDLKPLLQEYAASHLCDYHVKSD